MKKIVTIWWWNGHSSILKWLYKNFKKNNTLDKFSITSIVAMSDDGRTTGLLMKQMQEFLGMHMPPPWDLRRCFFSLSDSIYRDEFESLLETIIDFHWNIEDYNIMEILVNLWEKSWFIKNLNNHNQDFLYFKLPLKSTIYWHKFWNILMAILYYNFWDYNKMVDFMSYILDVKAKVIPVTTDPAFIFATLENWEIIETQDKISNIADYNSRIKNISLTDNCKNTKINSGIYEALSEADYIIIWPWDLYTSIDSNFVIPWLSELVVNSKWKKIYILNQTNKKWEATNYSELDFIDVIQSRISWTLDVVFANSKEPVLNDYEKELFNSSISVKWGRYLFIDQEKKEEILKKYPNLKFKLWNYLNKKTLFKNNKYLINDLIKYMN